MRGACCTMVYWVRERCTYRLLAVVYPVHGFIIVQLRQRLAAASAPGK